MGENRVDKFPAKMRIERQRGKILEGARLAFATLGFSKTSMVQIASVSGVSRASLYQHFGSKEEVFRASVVELHDRSIQQTIEVLDTEGLSLEERLSAIIDARLGYFARLLDGSPHGRELERTSVKLTSDIIAQSTKEYVDKIASLLRAADRCGSIDLSVANVSAKTAANLLVNGVQGQRYGLDQSTTFSEFQKQSRRYIRIFLLGMAYTE